MNLQQTDLETEASNAIRRSVARDNYTVFTRAMDSVGKTLQTGSAPYLLPLLTGLTVDVAYSLVDFISSDWTKQKLIELEEDSRLVDRLDHLEGVLSSLEGIVQENNEEEREHFDQIKKQRDVLVLYCQENGVTPEEVMNSTEGRSAVLEGTYGSIDLYEEKAVKIPERVMETLEPILEMIDMLPITPFVSMGVVALAEEHGIDINQVNLYPSNVGNLVSSFVQDLAKFTGAYMTETIKLHKEQIAEYRADLE